MEYKEYGQLLKEIGKYITDDCEEITLTSDIHTIERFLFLILKKFNKIISLLQSITPPEIVKRENEELLLLFEHLADVTKKGFSQKRREEVSIETGRITEEIQLVCLSIMTKVLELCDTPKNEI
ncbi:MAG: hypothetical protein ACQET8_07775 [Bacillota bacterium]|uniref:hypothetical protein n=1 Tax=Fictibacillus TaxID=1329200 RepID=UPI0018CF5BB4|nr:MULTISPECIES: hypothetical protein [unclassified Fictibacillus]MBH0157178.1 hypothetical protein [Fictibacillus sp. 5RED26]MBH0159499.1 hypothetical protein [Fictibacillus sp. 26RED30]MBH0163701.1 hypothetical protein [Fictibacillus sp. 7GRE50]MBH0169672.1 hypothetical protein [Fictibacillus sp. 18YEL24]MBH0174172.1 hypothetical protein [Fictibacillus sp. 23RED33]